MKKLIFVLFLIISGNSYGGQGGHADTYEEARQLCQQRSDSCKTSDPSDSRCELIEVSRCEDFNPLLPLVTAFEVEHPTFGGTCKLNCFLCPDKSIPPDNDPSRCNEEPPTCSDGSQPPNGDMSQCPVCEGGECSTDCNKGERKRFEVCSNPQSYDDESEPVMPPVKKNPVGEDGCVYKKVGSDEEAEWKGFFRTNSQDKTIQTCSSEYYEGTGAKQTPGAPQPFNEGQPIVNDDPPPKEHETSKTPEETTELPDGTTQTTSSESETYRLPGVILRPNDDTAIHTGGVTYTESTTTTTTTGLDGSSTVHETTVYIKNPGGITTISNGGVGSGGESDWDFIVNYEPQKPTSETQSSTTNYDEDGNETGSSSSGPKGPDECNPKIEYCGGSGIDGDADGDGVEDGTFGGSAQGGLYEKSDLTYQGVIQKFTDDIKNVEIAKEGKDFFNVNVSGSCPVWETTIPFVNFQFTFDHLCKEPMTSTWPWIKAFILATAFFIAFRMAFP